MDRLRVQVQELLRRKPNAPGSESLQQQLTELLSRWQELLQAIRIRLLLIQEFKDFQVPLPSQAASSLAVSSLAASFLVAFTLASFSRVAFSRVAFSLVAFFLVAFP